MSYPQEYDYQNQMPLDPHGFDNMNLAFGTGAKKPEDMGSMRELDSSEIIQDYELKLRGFQVDEDGNVRKVGRNKMNDEGINWLIGYISPILTRNTYLSEYPEPRCYMMTRDHIFTICSHLFKNHLWYELDISDYVPIIDDCESMILSAYLRAKDGGEREYRKTVIQLRMSEVQKHQDQRKGFMSRMRSFGIFKGDGEGDE